MPPTRTVLVCEAQVPFVHHGGAELLVRGLVGELTRRGFRAERVSIPFKWYPKDQLLTHAATWRIVDLSESNGVRIDAVIATRFPTYFVRHPNKITWLLHQHRPIYDLCGTPYSDFDHTEGDVGLRDRLIELDTTMIAESTRLFTIARNTSARLARFNGIAAEPLYHPPPLAGRLGPGPFGDYLLSVGRLEATKRVDLIVRALAHTDRRLRLVVVGDGPLRSQLEELASRTGVADRVTWTGSLDDDGLIGLYAGALGIVFPPFDEDYGYVTLEAFLARKPVITTVDAGGPLEFVEDAVTGLIVDPTPEAIGDAANRLLRQPSFAPALGENGFQRAKLISWDEVVSRLMAGVQN